MSLDALRGRAAASGARLLLAGPDPGRLSRIADALRADGLASVRVVGPGDLRPAGHPRLDAVATLLRSREPDRVRDGIHALDLAAEPLRFATALVALGEADAVVTAPEVEPRRLAEAGLWTLGRAADGAPLGSASWLALPDGRLIGCADCVFEGPPEPQARARLALAASRLASRVSGERAQVAFLAGPSPEDAAVAAGAVSAFEALAPGLPARLARSLAPDGADPRFRGRGDVLIFPTSTAGHLALGTARALAGGRLLGPVLLGIPGVLAATAADADDGELAGTAALAAVLAVRTTT